MVSIAVVVPELLPVPAVQGGAVEHWVQETFTRLQDGQTRVTVISRPAGDGVASPLRHVAIPWTAAERWWARLKERVTWRNPLRYAAKLQNVWSYGRRAGAAVRALHADIVNIHNEPNLLFFIAARPGQRLVLHMHNDHLSLRLFRPFYRRALARADRVVFISDYLRRQALAHFPEHAARFAVVPNATDPAVFRPYGAEARQRLAAVLPADPGLQYLLYVGRLVEIKGVHVLIEAFRQLHARRPATRLVIAGSSFFAGAASTPYVERLVALAAPVRDAIIFTGYLPHEQLRYLYAAADVALVPSVWQEPSGLVVLEAMASGACVVASAVGGIPELLRDGDTGLLVAPDDAAAIAAAVDGLLDQPARRQRIAAQARARVLEYFTWDRLVADLHHIFGSRA
ncbi:glycosyltransferase family 4 protein [Duganella callida]|uniref:Glycosyltransferase family 1 protein n=1 Tax=Duganella callida TaxID=2561932 RepID=A0A4Y9S8J2_9BURK|nr:glycosyltransferase family 4 protein [Duganella callida]TFW16413.1 glycosyltransferase family 1 protein [Duganella callida]